METFNLILTKFTDETITISALILFFLLGIIIVYWFYNRRKFHKLSHQIPAYVLKNYLDSIIENSNALKSSLFRGGGLELGEGIPAVVPVATLPTSTVNQTGDSSAELNQKSAEINTLKSQLSEKVTIVSELEKRLQEATLGNSGGGEEVAIIQEELGKSQAQVHEKDDEIAKLKEQLENSGSDGGGSEVEMAELTKERDDLKERLMEYEIIEEDLANLKRLQQENEALKKELADLKGGAAPAADPAPVAEPVPAADPEPVAEPAPAAEPVEEIVTETGPEDKAGATEASAEQKTADELLSEFEKMLG